MLVLVLVLLVLVLAIVLVLVMVMELVMVLVLELVLARRVMQSQREDMAQGKSCQGHPIQPVIHMAFMDMPESMTGTASAWVGPQAKRR